MRISFTVRNNHVVGVSIITLGRLFVFYFVVSFWDLSGWIGVLPWYLLDPMASVFSISFYLFRSEILFYLLGFIKFFLGR